MLLVPGKARGQRDGWAISSLQHLETNVLETWVGWHQVWYKCGKVTHSEAAGLDVALGQGRKIQPSRLNALLCENVGMDYGGQLAVSAMASQANGVHPSFVSLLPTLFACPAISPLSENSATMCRVRF